MAVAKGALDGGSLDFFFVALAVVVVLKCLVEQAQDVCAVKSGGGVK